MNVCSRPAVNVNSWLHTFKIKAMLVVNSSMFESDLQKHVSVPQDGDKEMIEISIDLAENDVFTVKVLATNT